MFDRAGEEPDLILRAVWSGEHSKPMSRFHRLSRARRLEDVLVVADRVRVRHLVKDLFGHQGVVGAGIVAHQQINRFPRRGRKLDYLLPADILIVFLSSSSGIARKILVGIRAVESTRIDVDDSNVVGSPASLPGRLGTAALAQVLGKGHSRRAILQSATVFTQHLRNFQHRSILCRNCARAGMSFVSFDGVATCGAQPSLYDVVGDGDLVVLIIATPCLDSYVAKERSSRSTIRFFTDPA